ncbi:hypothetical protein PMI32_05037, partial [Pseudomonas sp. GM60]
RALGYLALLQVTRRKGETNISHHKKNGYTPKQRNPEKTKSSRGFLFKAAQTSQSITLILGPKLRTVFSDIQRTRLSVFTINTNRIHIQRSRLTDLRRRHHWQRSMRGSDGRCSTKNRKDETKTNNAFHDVAPELWEEDGPTVALEHHDEKTPSRIVFIENVDPRRQRGVRSASQRCLSCSRRPSWRIVSSACCQRAI